MNWSDDRRMTLGFGLSLIAVIVVSVLAYRNAQQFIDTNRWVIHTLDVLDKLNVTFINVEDAETAVRGYVITGDESYLEPYNSAHLVIDDAIQHLRELTTDNPAQQQKLDALTPLITERFEILAHVIALRMEDGFIAAQQGIQTNQGNNVMAQIRAAFAAMKDDENNLLQQRSADAQAAAEGTLGTFIFLTLVVAGVVSLTYYYLRRDSVARRRVEKRLLESEKRFSTVFHANPAAMSLTRLADGKFVDVNTAFEKMAGYERQEIIGHTSTEINIWDADQRKMVTDVLREQGFAHNIEIPFRQKSGRTGALVSAEVMETGGESTLLAVIYDISERREAEEMLRYYAGLAQSISDAVVSTDEDFMIRSWNHGAEELYGWKAEEVIGKPINTVLYTDYLQDEQEAVRRELLDKGYWRGEVIQTCKDTQKINILSSVTLLKDNAGKSDGMVVVNHDISDRKRMEEALRISEERFHRIFDNMSEACQIIGFDWHYLYLNNTAVNESQYKREELMGHTLMERYPGIELTEMFAAMRRSMEERIALVQEFDFTLPDGSSAWYEFSIQPSREGIFIISNNITKRKQAQEQIQQLNHDLQHRTVELEAVNKELESFSYSVSHDLRAPLRSIDGFSKILLEDYGEVLDGTGQAYLERVRGAANRMAELIDDLINLSRVTRIEMEPEDVDLSRLARVVAASLREHGPDRNVDFIIAEGMVARGDLRLLRIVLENLIGNAWKFTSKRPQACIEIGTIEHPKDGTVYFVRDDGEGFDQAYAGKLFGAFQRLHGMNEFEGTGIGLATVKRIIQRHGGRVWAEGEIGKGASFYFMLQK